MTFFADCLYKGLKLFIFFNMIAILLLLMYFVTITLDLTNDERALYIFVLAHFIPSFAAGGIPLFINNSDTAKYIIALSIMFAIAILISVSTTLLSYFAIGSYEILIENPHIFRIPLSATIILYFLCCVSKVFMKLIR